MQRKAAIRFFAGSGTADGRWEDTTPCSKLSGDCPVWMQVHIDYIREIAYDVLRNREEVRVWIAIR